MAQANPYSPPGADIESHGVDGVDETSPLSPAGRFTRLSYLGWGMLLGLLYLGVQLMIGIVLGAATAGPPEAAEGVGAAAVSILGLVAMVAMIGFSIVFTIRRCHDFNASGWWALLTLIPLANLVFYFIPGTQGPNRFGPMRPTRTWEKVVGLLLLSLAVVGGILAAIAIPAYQDYLQRTQEARELGAVLSLLTVA